MKNRKPEEVKIQPSEANNTIEQLQPSEDNNLSLEQPDLQSSAIGVQAAAARSPHGLDDSDTTGSHGYDVHSRNEAFTGSAWPKNAVWNRLWDFCDDTHCDGSFTIENEWAICYPRQPGQSGGTCHPHKQTTRVTVKGDYGDRRGWDVRENFMQDLSQHHYGDGGVYHNGDAFWGQGFGFPGGWWVAGSTWIRRSGSGFWVNIEIQ